MGSNAILLLICALGLLCSIWVFFTKKQYRLGIWLLCLAAFAFRLYMAFVDPFLHDWDERFHALVAKNMISSPFIPLLRVDPILPYDYTAWCCNHIWVHKQPLFLWQMALSMKIFGVQEWALRLPSAVLSALMSFWVYRIALIWTKEKNTAFLAALLSAFSYYQLELTAGYLSLDHNDLVFTCYITASIWAFCEYTKQLNFRWALLAGFFAGLAILVKWLTAMLVFGGAGLYLLSQEGLIRNINFYKHWLAAFGLSIAIMLPWQLYILQAFPKESAWEYLYNFKHVTERLGAFTAESYLYYIKQFSEQYGVFLVPFLFLGLFVVLFTKKYPRRFNIPMLGMLTVVYGFFSIFVETKMPAFVYIVSGIILVLLAIGLNSSIQSIIGSTSLNNRPWVRTGIFLLIAIACSQPWRLSQHHSSRDAERQAKINNTEIFRNLDKEVAEDVVVFNCKSHADIELMFYQKHRAYHWYPPEKQLDSLLENGYKIAAFQSHTNQGLPEYIDKNPRVQIIRKEIK